MFIVSQQRKKDTPEYRREAANLVIESQRPIAHVSKEICVGPGLLGRWSNSSQNAKAQMMAAVMPIYEPKTSPAS